MDPETEVEEEDGLDMIDLQDNQPQNQDASVEGELPFAPRIPWDIYKFAIKEEPEFVEKSKSSGNPMLVFTLELIEPESVVVDGVEGKCAGKEFQYYCTLQKGKYRNLLDLHKATNLPLKIGFDKEDGMPIAEVDGEMVKIEYTGLEFYGFAVSELEEMTKEDADGNQVPVIDPYTGEAMTRARAQFKRIHLPPSVQE